MRRDNIERLVIVGGGASGWMAAALFSKLFGPTLRVELVESDAIGVIGVGEATIPPIQLFNRALGMDEDEFVRATQGTFKLGIEFRDWGRVGDRYMHAFGDIGLPLGLAAFHHHWLRSRHEGHEAGLWRYSLNHAAAQAQRFDRIERIEGTPLAGLRYAFHFDAALYARHLRAYSERHGVVRSEGEVTRVNLRAADGFIESLSLASGETVSGELFIDCTGLRGLLIAEAMGVGFESWSQWLRCDRALAVPSEATRPLAPYTQATARQAGWQWRIPLQHRTGNGHVYASDYLSDDEAHAILMRNLDGAPLAEPRLIRFQTGRRKRFWHKNCVAVGLAAGFMEPLESTSIHLAQMALTRLVQLFPDRRFATANIDEFNRQTTFEHERIRDFLVLHYHANERDDSPFWKDCRETPPPPELERKMALFRSSGQVHRIAHELFSDAGWLQVMLGQHVEPEAYHAMADVPSPEQLNQFLQGLLRAVHGTVATLPSHASFIEKHCAAPSG